MLLLIPSCVFSFDERHKLCASWFRCGNQTDLYYPFWSPEREECGHPDFKVNCSGGFAELSIFSVKFQILEMNNGIIRLARKDYRNNLCPQYPESASINQDVLPFSPDTMLSNFYYNCSDPLVDVPPNTYTRQIDCEDDIGRKSYFVSLASDSVDIAILHGLSASCERNVNIPVSRSAMRIEERNQSLDALKKAVDTGFELRMSLDCSQCVASGGACGNNLTSRAFVCYCINEPHKQTCPSGRNST